MKIVKYIFTLNLFDYFYYITRSVVLPRYPDVTEIRLGVGTWESSSTLKAGSGHLTLAVENDGKSKSINRSVGSIDRSIDQSISKFQFE